MEKIKAAAIKYRRKGKTEFEYVWGASHDYCIMALCFIDLYPNMRDMNVEESGFITTEGRFVGRAEANKIALEAGQISKFYDKEELYSEFINWNV